MDLPHIITITYPSGLCAPLTTGYTTKRAAVKEFFKRIEPRTADVLHDSQYTFAAKGTQNNRTLYIEPLHLFKE